MNGLQQEENHDAWLTLSLALPSPQPSPPPPPPPPSAPAPSLPLPAEYLFPFAPPPMQMQYPLFFFAPEPKPELELLPKCEFSHPREHQEQEAAGGNSRRQRRAPVRPKNPAKPDAIPPPYPWATSKRATVYSLQHLLGQGLTTISGTVKCKVCQSQRDMEFDLEEKFEEVGKFIRENKQGMHDRAPECWKSPVLPPCDTCGRENVSMPVITKKRAINWLFLLLGQMIACCNLDQLKYFCKHTKKHRTGAKDRLLYLTYLGLCKQLQPDGPFDP